MEQVGGKAAHSSGKCMIEMEVLSGKKITFRACRPGVLEQPSLDPTANLRLSIEFSTYQNGYPSNFTFHGEFLPVKWAKLAHQGSDVTATREQKSSNPLQMS